MARLEMISCAAYCADATDMVQLRIIKEILRIDKSRSCFDFATVFRHVARLGFKVPSKFANLAKSPLYLLCKRRSKIASRDIVLSFP
jgi:hypothetical protein